MDKGERRCLREKYSALKKKYKSLRNKYFRLLEAYKQSLEQKPLKLLTNKSFKLHKDSPQRSDKKHHSVSVQLTPASQSLYSSQRLLPVPSLAPAAHPDQSVEYDYTCGLLEAFAVVGIPQARVAEPLAQPQLLWEYQGESGVLTAEVKEVLVDFCMPLGVQKRQLQQTASNSELNSLLFGQSTVTRDQSSFVFTVRTETEGLLYACCLQFDEVMSTVDGQEWIVSKVYCVLSSLACFDLHFDLLEHLLKAKRLQRMQLFQTNAFSLTELSKVPISNCEVDVVQQYGALEELEPGKKACIEVEALGPVVLEWPEDFTSSDIPWTCCTLLAALSLEDLLWLLSAFALEQSILVISDKPGVVSSCVLGLVALFRPLEWPNVVIPVLPRKLEEFVDSPVPILAGLLNRSLIVPSSFVQLYADNPCKSQRLHKNEVSHRLKLTQLKKTLQTCYEEFGEPSPDWLSPSKKQIQVACKFARVIQSFWEEVQKAVPKCVDLQGRELCRLTGFYEEEAFFAELCKTQALNNLFPG